MWHGSNKGGQQLCNRTSNREDARSTSVKAKEMQGEFDWAMQW